MLLNEWIQLSPDLRNYNEIRKSRLCVFVDKRKKMIENIDSITILNKTSVLIKPLVITDFTQFLDVTDSFFQPYLQTFGEQGILEKKDDLERWWFKHELIQKCLEDSLDKKIKQQGSIRMRLIFILHLFEKDKTSDNVSNDTAIAYAYHLHKAGMHQESYTLNKKLADGASIIGRS